MQFPYGGRGREFSATAAGDEEEPIRGVLLGTEASRPQRGQGCCWHSLRLCAVVERGPLASRVHSGERSTAGVQPLHTLIGALVWRAAHPAVLSSPRTDPGV